MTTPTARQCRTHPPCPSHPETRATNTEPSKAAETTRVHAPLHVYGDTKNDAKGVTTVLRNQGSTVDFIR